MARCLGLYKCIFSFINLSLTPNRNGLHSPHYKDEETESLRSRSSTKPETQTLDSSLRSLQDNVVVELGLKPSQGFFFLTHRLQAGGHREGDREEEIRRGKTRESTWGLPRKKVRVGQQHTAALPLTQCLTFKNHFSS